MHPALYSPNPYLGAYSEFDMWEDPASDYYVGAFPNPLGTAYDMGQGLGQALRRNAPPGIQYRSPLGSSSNIGPSNPDDRFSTDWSGVAKIALVVGGAAAIYFIYRASKAASPVAERLGNMAGKLAMARAGGSMNRLNPSSARDAEVISSSSRKLLNA